ncbi:MAG: hypothetical protein ACRD1V_03490 [Vicinamibacterales bacterium]
MAEVTISLRHRPSNDEHTCGVCGATFVPSEDSGSRVLGLKSGTQEFDFLLCGGCHSKWIHGASTRVRSMPVNAASSSSSS